jgi:hypothetical protein
MEIKLGQVMASGFGRKVCAANGLLIQQQQ